MKIAQFLGRIPRLASRLLPDQNADVCINARLKSGDLECWNDEALIDTPTKSGTKNVIYPLDLYSRYPTYPGPYWAHWTTSEGTARIARVSAKPPSDAATNERFFFVGTDRPRWTDIPNAIDGVGTNYPLTTFYAGVKAPTAAPTIAAITVDTYAEVDATYNGSDMGGWKTSDSLPDDTNNVVDAVSGEFKFQAQNLAGLDKTVYMARDDGFGGAYYSKVLHKFRLTASSVADDDGIYSGWLGFSYGCDENGSGNFIYLQMRSNNTGRVYLGNQSSWDEQNYTPLGAAMSGTPTLGTNYYLQVEITKDVTTNGDGEETISIKVGTTPGASDLYNQSFTRYLAVFAVVFGAPLVSYRDVGISGTWYAWSLSTFAQSNGPHISYVDDIELTLVGQDTGEGAEASRYAYTWVNEYGEESAPSPLSAIVPMDDELTISLSAIADPSAGDITNYGIVGKRLYRAVSDGDTTVLRLVADQTALPNGTTTYDDSTNTEDLSTTVLQSEDWTEPPADCIDICALSNGIMLYVTEDGVYPSVAYQPHAIVLDWAHSADFRIVGALAIENQAIVWTEECPHLIRGDDPSAMSMDRISSVYGLASKYSLVRWKEFGVCGASFDGFIAVSASGATNLTEEFFTREEWAALNPTTMKCAVYDEILFVCHSAGSFMFHPQFGVVDIELDGAATIATAVYSDPIKDRLFMVVSGNIVEWNAGAYTLQATWKGGIRQLPYPMVFTAGEIRAPTPDSFAESVTMKLYRNGSASAYSTTVASSDQEFRLLADDTSVAKEVQIELITAGGVVNTVQIAEDMDGLE